MLPGYESLTLAMEEPYLRTIIRLLGETTATPGGHAEKKRTLVEAIASLTGSDAWVWTLTQHSGADDHWKLAGILHGGLSAERFVALNTAAEHPDTAKAAGHFHAAALATRHHTTMDESEIDPERHAFKGELGRLWAATGLGPTILSGRYLDDTSLSIAAFYRNVDREPFSAREKQIIHLILSEIPWLHLTGWPKDRGSRALNLTPRQRTVLNLLLEGLGKKQIANHLDLSPHTIKDYIRIIYRHYGVGSQAELMNQYQIRGNHFKPQNPNK